MKKRIKGVLRKLAGKEVHVVREPVSVGDELEQRHALVVGGTGGIGRAISKALHERGAKVLVTGSTQSSVDAALDSLPGGTQGAVLDVCSVGSFGPFLEAAASRLGGLDVIVYCAGVHGSDDFGSVSEETWDKVMSVNLKGAYFMCQVAGNLMVRENVRGHILIVGSASALKPGWTPYEISKRGIQSLVQGAADRLAPYGVTVNCIAPGPVATQMLGCEGVDDLGWSANPYGRLARPEEIASLAAYMVSDLGSLIVGDSFYITGGSGTVSNG